MPQLAFSQHYDMKNNLSTPFKELRDAESSRKAGNGPVSRLA
jgi:hypothetical protein